jgi:hypothetical protein
MPKSTKNLPVLTVNESACAKATSLSLPFLRKDRITDQRIPFIKIGKRVMYDLDAVHAALRTMQHGGVTK